MIIKIADNKQKIAEKYNDDNDNLDNNSNNKVAGKNINFSA